MKLVIDFGNTFQKLARFEGKALTDVVVFQNLTPDELLTFILDKGPFERSILSAVTAIDERFFDILKHTTDYTDFSEDMPLPVTLKYETPATLGKDRIAASAAAVALWPDQDVLTIDAGTCITYDLTSHNREYLGGAISPGLSMRLKALHNFTGQLPLIELEEFHELTGTSTRDSILSGVVQGTVEEILGFTRRYRDLYPGLVVALTGGDHKFLHNHLKNSIFAVPNLVLTGLNEILDHNDVAH